MFFGLSECHTDVTILAERSYTTGTVPKSQPDVVELELLAGFGDGFIEKLLADQKEP